MHTHTQTHIYLFIYLFPAPFNLAHTLPLKMSRFSSSSKHRILPIGFTTSQDLKFEKKWADTYCQRKKLLEIYTCFVIKRESLEGMNERYQREVGDSF